MSGESSGRVEIYLEQDGLEPVDRHRLQHAIRHHVGVTPVNEYDGRLGTVRQAFENLLYRGEDRPIGEIPADPDSDLDPEWAMDHVQEMVEANGYDPDVLTYRRAD